MMLLKKPLTIDKTQVVTALRTRHPAECDDAKVRRDESQPAHSVLLSVAGQSETAGRTGSRTVDLPDTKWRGS
jgi:hypothetical protein